MKYYLLKIRVAQLRKMFLWCLHRLERRLMMMIKILRIKPLLNFVGPQGHVPHVGVLKKGYLSTPNLCTGSRSAPRQGLPGERQNPPWSLFGPSKNKVFEPRPRQEELAGKATQREQGPGKRSLPGRPLEAQGPGKRSLLGRPTKARQETCYDAPCVPARTGEQQAPGRDKASTAARRLSRQVTTPRLRSSSSTHASLWGRSRRTWREAAQPGECGGKAK